MINFTINLELMWTCHTFTLESVLFEALGLEVQPFGRMRLGLNRNTKYSLSTQQVFLFEEKCRKFLCYYPISPSSNRRLSQTEIPYPFWHFTECNLYEIHMRKWYTISGFPNGTQR